MKDKQFNQLLEIFLQISFCLERIENFQKKFSFVKDQKNLDLINNFFKLRNESSFIGEDLIKEFKENGIL